MRERSDICFRESVERTRNPPLAHMNVKTCSSQQLDSGAQLALTEGVADPIRRKAASSLMCLLLEVQLETMYPPPTRQRTRPVEKP